MGSKCAVVGVGRVDFTVRDIDESDHKFIFDSFMKSWVAHEYKSSIEKLSSACKFFSIIPKRFYFSAFREIIDKIIYDGDYKVLIACDTIDPSCIYGYMIYCRNPSTIIFCYVKDINRRLGICGLMVNFTFRGHDKKINTMFNTKVGNKFLASLKDISFTPTSKPFNYFSKY